MIFVLGTTMTKDEYSWLGKTALVRHIKTGEVHQLRTKKMGGWLTTHDSRKWGRGGILICHYDMIEDYEVESFDGAYCVCDLRLETFYDRDQRKAAQK